MRRQFTGHFFTAVALAATLSGADSVGTAPSEWASGTHALSTLEWHSIDFPGAISTGALDISAAGAIVGSYMNATGTHGYRRSSTGGFVSIDVPGSNFTRVAGISSNGDIVGTYRLPTDPAMARHGFLLRDGEFTTIDPPGAVFTNPLGINSSGDIVGRFCTTLPCMPEGTNVHGFLLRSGVYFTIDIPGSKGTNAWKINAHGDIVGGYTDADGSRRIFLLRLREHFSAVDAFGTGEPELDNGGINSRGEIVGVFCDTSPCRGLSPGAHGFLLALRRPPLERITFPGAIVTNAFSINERGDIVGFYEDATGVHGFLLTRR